MTFGFVVDEMVNKNPRTVARVRKARFKKAGVHYFMIQSTKALREAAKTSERNQRKKWAVARRKIAD